MFFKTKTVNLGGINERNIRLYINLQSLREIIKATSRKSISRYFPGGPVVNNPPDNAGDTGLIPSGGLGKFPRALGQPNL